MSDEPTPPAARLHDPVAHSHALGGFVAGALVGLAAAAGVAIVVGMAATAIAAEVATAGLATPLVAGVAVTVGEFAINAVVGGKLMGLAEDAGEALGSSSMGAFGRDQPRLTECLHQRTTRRAGDRSRKLRRG